MKEQPPKEFFSDEDIPTDYKTVIELSEEFGVSERTILHRISLLRHSDEDFGDVLRFHRKGERGGPAMAISPEQAAKLRAQDRKIQKRRAWIAIRSAMRYDDYE